MQGFVKTRASRRQPGLASLAAWLGKNHATLWRWVEKRPELHPVLRLRRHGKQWRIDWPRTAGETEAWLEQVREAIAPFTRTPKRTTEWVRNFCAGLGFGDEQRDRDIETLRHAMLLKYAVRNLHAQEPDTEERVEDDPPSLAHWEDEAAHYWSTARMVSAEFKCRVEDVPNYWCEFCRKSREKNRAFNTPTYNWLKAHGLYNRAMQLLPKGSGDLIAFIGARRADGKARIKLYRDRLVWKSDQERGWRKMYFHTQRFQLLPVRTDGEIADEVRRMNELWPELSHWQRAKKHLETDWQLKTLGEAALKCAEEAKPIIGANLAPLLFRNLAVQDMWKLHQEHLILKERGIDVFCDEAQTTGNHGKRGISLREFGQRYNRKQIIEARKTAEAAYTVSMETAQNKESIYGTEQAEDRDPRQKDETGVGVRDERGAAITNATEKDEDFVLPQTALRWKRLLEQSKPELDAVPQDERRKVEAVLGRTLEDYTKKPFKEDFKPA